MHDACGYHRSPLTRVVILFSVCFNTKSYWIFGAIGTFVEHPEKMVALLYSIVNRATLTSTLVTSARWFRPSLKSETHNKQHTYCNHIPYSLKASFVYSTCNHIVTSSEFLPGRSKRDRHPVFIVFGLTYEIRIGIEDPTARQKEFRNSRISDISYYTGRALHIFSYDLMCAEGIVVKGM